MRLIHFVSRKLYPMFIPYIYLTHKLTCSSYPPWLKDGGLVSFWVYRQTKDPVWAERGRQNKATMKKWVETASEHNFQQKLYLLEAEEAFCSGDSINAKLFYEHAVTAARKHR